MIYKCSAPLQVNEQGMEITDHGTSLFPISCFAGDVATDPVLLHWHEDWELVEVLRGTVNLSVEGHLFRLQAA